MMNKPLTPLRLPHLSISALQLQSLLAAQLADDQLLYGLDKKTKRLDEVMDAGKHQARQLKSLFERTRQHGLLIERFLPLSEDRIQRNEQMDLLIRWLRFMVSNQIGVRFEVPFPDWFLETNRPLVEKLQESLCQWAISRIESTINGLCNQQVTFGATELTDLMGQLLAYQDVLSAAQGQYPQLSLDPYLSRVNGTAGQVKKIIGGFSPEPGPQQTIREYLAELMHELTWQDQCVLP